MGVKHLHVDSTLLDTSWQLHKGNIVTVEGRLMYEPKANALSAREPLLYCLSALNRPVRTANWYLMFSLT